MQLFPVGKTYDFMSKRRLFALLSLLAVIVSVVALFVPGPKLGTDFQGGTEVEVAFKKPILGPRIQQVVTSAGFSRPDVIKVQDDTNPHRYLIRVKEVSTIDAPQQAEIEKRLCYGDGLSKQSCPPEKRSDEVKFSPGGDKITVRFQETPDLQWVAQRMKGLSGIALREGDNPLLQNARANKVEIQLKSKGDQIMDVMRDKLGASVVPENPLRVEWIGPKAGAQLRDAALKSIAIALVFIMMYIAFRFDLRFAPGSVVALVHDAMVTIGVLIALRKELNLTTVAAILTIVGYSVNDTVVVYDRVRENLGKLRGASFIGIINSSLSEMLSRTVLTSGTTIFSLLALFVWGTGTLKDFALTLVIGLILGTYSSMFVALPLTHWLDHRFFSKIGKKKKTVVGKARKAEAAT